MRAASTSPSAPGLAVRGTGPYVAGTMTLHLPEGVTYADPRLTLTPKAVEMAKAKLLDAGEPVYGLRIGGKGSGCEGYSYVID